MAYPSVEEAKRGRVEKICPVRQCEGSIPLTHLMCPMHWEAVGGPLRRAIVSQWVRGRMPHEQPKSVQLLINQAKDEAWDAT